MPAEVLICDETTSGEVEERFVLRLVSERITARELLERRIEEEVATYNKTLPEYFRGLVRPSEAERALNGYRLKTRRKIDAQRQFGLACKTFEQNGFLMLVGDAQVLELDEEITVGEGTRVRFVRLVPLVGG